MPKISLKRIEDWTAKLPSYERELPLVIIDKKAFTPDEICAQIKEKTRLSLGLQQKLDLGPELITAEKREQIWSLAKLRLNKLYTDRPVTVLTLTLAKPTISAAELKHEIEQETELGKELIKDEINHMRYILSLLKEQ